MRRSPRDVRDGHGTRVARGWSGQREAQVVGAGANDDGAARAPDRRLTPPTAMNNVTGDVAGLAA